ncbi:MAG: Hsp20 family protein [Thermoplasmatales archaeon]|nr:Hsp20 family protein [Thermoplasmatales archaeon]
MVKKKKQEKKEEPVVGFGVDFGGIFKGLGDFINMAAKLAEQGQTEFKRTGEITSDNAKKLRGMYGFSVRVGRQGIPVIDKFGTVTPKVKPREIKPGAEVREPLVDVFDEKNKIVIVAELPGVEEKAIKTAMKGNILNISAESADRKYSKEVKLPSKVTGKIESTYKNGVLELKLKKKK